MCLPCVQSSSSTMTEVEIANQPAESRARNTLVLKLKGTRKPSVSWAVDTVNNENMKKKSSKRKKVRNFSLPSTVVQRCNRRNSAIKFVRLLYFPPEEKFRRERFLRAESL